MTRLTPRRGVHEDGELAGDLDAIWRDATGVCRDPRKPSRRVDQGRDEWGRLESALRHLTGTGQVFLMLAGLAIENLAKALLVHRKLVSVTKGSITRKDLQAHGVETLLGRAGVKLSKEERRLIRRLDKAVEWSGRYPVPLTATTLTTQSEHVSSLTDPEEFTTLFRRLASELPPRGKPHVVLAREISFAKQDPRGPKGK
jgi:hypothetical protein